MTDLELKLYLLALEVMKSPRFINVHQVDIVYLAKRDGLASLDEDIWESLKKLRPVLNRLEAKGYLVRATVPDLPQVWVSCWVPIDLLTAMAKGLA